MAKKILNCYILSTVFYLLTFCIHPISEKKELKEPEKIFYQIIMANQKGKVKEMQGTGKIKSEGNFSFYGYFKLIYSEKESAHITFFSPLGFKDTIEIDKSDFQNLLFFLFYPQKLKEKFPLKNAFEKKDIIEFETYEEISLSYIKENFLPHTLKYRDTLFIFKNYNKEKIPQEIEIIMPKTQIILTFKDINIKF